MRLVLAHGVFDWLHHGHLEHLEQARAMGDRLIVSVVADRFIEKGRLVQADWLRVKMLEALRVVDEVVLSEDILSPCALLEARRPAVYVRGPDYADKRNPDSLVCERLGIAQAFTKTAFGISTSVLKRAQAAYLPTS